MMSEFLGLVGILICEFYWLIYGFNDASDLLQLSLFRKRKKM